MKNLILFFLLVSFTVSHGQELSEIDVQSKVNEVTVFIEGAQITRSKTVSISKGSTVFKFIGLSPYIDAKSIQVKTSNKITLLSVNHQHNYLNQAAKKQTVLDLENDLELVKEKINFEQTLLAVLKEELTFLQSNRSIGGKNEELSISTLKEASSFYSARLKEIKLSEIKHRKTISELEIEGFLISNQIRTMSDQKVHPTGEILIKVESEMNSAINFQLSYTVANAGWIPSYDIRAKNINSPIALKYKANIKQDTKVDWKNVKLSLSSANPNISGTAPDLETYLLNYNSLPPSYRKNITSVSGIVNDESGPLPGVNIMVKGTTIGTSSDFNGNYSLALPNNAQFLEYSYVGFETKSLPITSAVMNVNLIASAEMLEEVEVMGYSPVNSLLGKVSGLSIQNTSNSIRSKKEKKKVLSTTLIEKQTTLFVEINTPFTINSDNNNYTVTMDSYDLPAYYQYYSVPKADPSAYLMANISNWEQFNLLEGEANIFFEDTFIGKSVLDVRYVKDTLKISLGKDKNVQIHREKIKEYTSKRFIGSKKEETRAWKIAIKNNKSQPINLLIYDQVPVSTLDEIKVEVQETSMAKLNIETGALKWEFSLDPKIAKELNLSYAIKYPKYQNLYIE